MPRAFAVALPFDSAIPSGRRRDVTLERRKAAEERKRAEELKAQVCRSTPLWHLIPIQLTRLPWLSLVPEKPRGYDEKPAVRRRLHIDLVLLCFGCCPKSYSWTPISRNSPCTPHRGGLM